MIYLIDDKKQRQEKDYRWTSEQFEKYKELISPVYTLIALQERAKEIFKEGNIILYHESFLDKTDLNTKASIKRDKLDEFAKKNNSYLVYFSGSKNTRDIAGNIANIPVSVLYSNLENFVIKFLEKDINLKYLLFGENPDIEEELTEKLGEAQAKTNSEALAKIKGETLFIRPAIGNIANPIESATEQTVFNNVSDENLSEKIEQWLSEKIYNTIFIPLCFGSTLSDYSGLRLATHVRCTKTKNQTSRIFIYGFVGLDYLINNKYFNILKTRNAELVNFSKKAFDEVGNKTFEKLSIEELPKEISKLKLDAPKNYSDNHSVANEWAIYRWANAIGARDNKIEIILKKANYNLYFKYLQTIFPVSNIREIGTENLQIKGIEDAKVLYIDDEADKGWSEIFCTILCDINGVEDFDYICEVFKNKNHEEIINISLDRIRKQDSDIVILDFRLHENDFSKEDISPITGLRLLKEIKEINPGIQVIIFSATNKIWNFQALQNAGADGFIVKESPENSMDSEFTVNEIESFIKIVKISSERIYLKMIWQQLKELKKLTTKYDTDISIAFKLLYDSTDSAKYKNYAYLQLFLIIEKFISDDYIFHKNPAGSNYVIGKTGKELLVFDYLRTENKDPVYKSAITFRNGNYKKEIDDNFKRRLDTNSIVSALLIFRYGLDTSGEKDWTKIYKIRNDKAAHPENGIINQKELTMLINFLKFIIDENNINSRNEIYALENPSIKDQLNRLRKI